MIHKSALSKKLFIPLALLALAPRLALASEATIPAPIPSPILSYQRSEPFRLDFSANTKFDERVPSPHFEDECEIIREAVQDPNLHKFVIPKGTFLCKGPIFIDRSDFELSGQPEGATRLKLFDGANTPLLVIGDWMIPLERVNEISVHDLILDGNLENQTSECWGNACDTDMRSHYRNSALIIRGLSHGLFYNLVTTHARAHGVSLESGVEQVYFHHLHSLENYFDGLNASETVQSVFEYLELTKSLHGRGLTLDPLFNFNTLRYVSVVANQEGGIVLRAASNNLLQHFELKENNQTELYMTAFEDYTETCPSKNAFDRFLIRSHSSSSASAIKINGHYCPENILTNTQLWTRSPKDIAIDDSLSGQLTLSHVTYLQ